jgi:hypothetical protein
MFEIDTSYFSVFILIIVCMVGLSVAFSFSGQIINAIFNPSNPYIVKGLITGNGGTQIFAAEDIPIVRSENQNGIEFSYSVWINISNLDTSVGKYKHVFSKGDNVATPNIKDSLSGISYPNNAPGLYISPDTNALVVYMNTFNEIAETAVVSDVPLNKWLHVVIRVQQKYLDVYINGTLVKRTLLTSLPKQNYGNVYVTIGEGFNGSLSNLQYFDYALEPGAIMGLSASGPNLTKNSENKDLQNVPPSLSMQWYFSNTVENKI